MFRRVVIYFAVFGVFGSLPVNGDTLSQIIGNEVLSKHTFYISGPYGNSMNGEPFTDFWQSLNGREYLPMHWPRTINVRYGSRIDGIQLFYGNYRGKTHGGEGGNLIRLSLYNGDKISEVRGSYGIGFGGGINSLKFITSRGRELGPFGDLNSGLSFIAKPPRDNCFLAWVSGRAGLRIDALSITWKCLGDSLFSQTLENSFRSFTHQTGRGNSNTKRGYFFVFMLSLMSLRIPKNWSSDSPP